MSKWKKATIIIWIILPPVLIIYDIFAVVNDDAATLSNIIFIAMWYFPFIAYVYFVIGGHWLSPFKTKKRYTKFLVTLSIPVLVFSLINLIPGIRLKMTGIAMTGFALAGYLVGAITWSQRRHEK